MSIHFQNFRSLNKAYIPSQVLLSKFSKTLFCRMLLPNIHGLAEFDLSPFFINSNPLAICQGLVPLLTMADGRNGFEPLDSTMKLSSRLCRELGSLPRSPAKSKSEWLTIDALAVKVNLFELKVNLLEDYWWMEKPLLTKKIVRAMMKMRKLCPPERHSDSSKSQPREARNNLHTKRAKRRTVSAPSNDIDLILYIFVDSYDEKRLSCLLTSKFPSRMLN